MKHNFERISHIEMKIRDDLNIKVDVVVLIKKEYKGSRAIS